MMIEYIYQYQLGVLLIYNFNYRPGPDSVTNASLQLQGKMKNALRTVMLNSATFVLLLTTTSSNVFGLCKTSKVRLKEDTTFGARKSTYNYMK